MCFIDTFFCQVDEVHSLLSSLTAMNLSQRGGEDAKKN